MTKTYKIEKEEKNNAEESVIAITETETVTKDKTTTVANLKARREQLLEQIADLSSQADEIVDELSAIETNLGLTIADKPVKVVDEKVTSPKVHRK